MIIVKAPLRISIGGGGTDLPSYYEKFESEFVSAAINQYIYISIHPVFYDQWILKYSETERTYDINTIKHPIIREALQMIRLYKPAEISSFADVPSGTGLGSSGAFTVALLKALHVYQNLNHTPMQLAEMACQIEIEKLHAPIGKQDQYISAVGGLTKFHIDKTGHVTSSPLAMPAADRLDLEDHLLLFFTGYSRSANDVLRDQDEQTRAANQAKSDSAAKTQEPMSSEILDNLHFTKELGQQITRALEAGQIGEFGSLMNVHWEHKKKRSKKISSGPIDEWYDLARKNGALGGKLIGAGGGGFLMFLAEDKRRVRKAMREAKLQEVPFRFDNLGAQLVLHD